MWYTAYLRWWLKHRGSSTWVIISLTHPAMSFFSQGSRYQSGGQMLSSLKCSLPNCSKQISVNPQTHLRITYRSTDVTACAFIPASSPRGLRQSGKETHNSHLWKLSGRALPWCSGLSAGAMQTQTVISPAAARPGRTCDSHQKATVGFPKQNTANIVPSLLLGIGVDDMWLNCGVRWWVFPLQRPWLCIRSPVARMLEFYSTNYRYNQICVCCTYHTVISTKCAGPPPGYNVSVNISADHRYVQGWHFDQTWRISFILYPY